MKRLTSEEKVLRGLKIDMSHLSKIGRERMKLSFRLYDGTITTSELMRLSYLAQVITKSQYQDWLKTVKECRG